MVNKIISVSYTNYPYPPLYERINTAVLVFKSLNSITKFYLKATKENPQINNYKLKKVI